MRSALGRSLPIFAIALLTSQTREVSWKLEALRYMRPALGALIVLVSVYLLSFGRQLLAWPMDQAQPQIRGTT